METANTTKTQDQETNKTNYRKAKSNRVHSMS